MIVLLVPSAGAATAVNNMNDVKNELTVSGQTQSVSDINRLMTDDNTNLGQGLADLQSILDIAICDYSDAGWQARGYGTLFNRQNQSLHTIRQIQGGEPAGTVPGMVASSNSKCAGTPA